MSSVPDAVLDADRLAAVRACALLDSGPEEPFDRLTALASTLLDASAAFATVVDDRRSYWKSCVGVDAQSPGERQNPVEESFCQYVVGSEEALIVDDAARDPRTRDNPSVEKMGVAAWAGFPLRAPGGAVLGSFCVTDVRPREWSERDVEILRGLAAAAASEISLRSALTEANRAREHAQALAATLQENLLPPSLPRIEGLELAARYRPAGEGTELVGDFYDVVPMEEDRWSLAVGDVCGKGVEAAKTTALVRYTLVAAGLRSAAPSDVLRVLNEALLGHPDEHRFVTGVYGWLRRDADGSFAVDLCAGGHCPALLVRADGGVEEITEVGTLLGVLATLDLTDRTTRLHPGDTLVLHTDGVSEARGAGGLFGHGRLRTVLAATAGEPAAEVTARLETEAVAFSGGLLSDDLAVLAIRVPG